MRSFFAKSKDDDVFFMGTNVAGCAIFRLFYRNEMKIIEGAGKIDEGMIFFDILFERTIGSTGNIPIKILLDNYKAVTGLNLPVSSDLFFTEKEIDYRGSCGSIEGDTVYFCGKVYYNMIDTDETPVRDDYLFEKVGVIGR